MTIHFKVGKEQATYSRNWFTGRTEIVTNGQRLTLENPWSPATHLGLRPAKSWQTEIGGHRIFIEKTKPVLFAGLRPQTVCIKVDGQFVIQKTGY